jgi:hypothetical protein
MLVKIVPVAVFCGNYSLLGQKYGRLCRDCSLLGCNSAVLLCGWKEEIRLSWPSPGYKDARLLWACQLNGCKDARPCRLCPLLGCKDAKPVIVFIAWMKIYKTF